MQIFSFGKGSHGRLGQETDQAVIQPKVIQKLANVKVVGISAGCRHAACVTRTIYIYIYIYI